MGRLRTRTVRLERLLPDPTGQPDGLVVTTTSEVDSQGHKQYGYDLEAGGSGGGVQSVNSGTDITVDNTDPLNPIVNYTGPAGITVATVRAITALRAY